MPVTVTLPVVDGVTLMSPLMLWIETRFPAASAFSHLKSVRFCATAGNERPATRATLSSRRVMIIPGREFGYGRAAAPRPFEEMVMSPLNVSAVMRAAPPPIENVNRLALLDPI